MSGIREFTGRDQRRGETVLHDLAQPVDQLGHFGREPRETGLSAVTALVHIEGAVDLDLQGMAAALGAAVMPGRKAAGIGRVERDGEVALGQKLPRRFDDLRGAGGAVAIAEHDIGGLRPARQAGRRRHRVAIDQEIAAEHLLGLLDKPAQCLMVGVVQGISTRCLASAKRSLRA